MRRGQDSAKRFPHPEGQLKGGEALLVFADALGKKIFFGTMLFQFLCSSVGLKIVTPI